MTKKSTITHRVINDCAWQAIESFRTGTALFLFMFLLAVAGATVPAQAATYTELFDFLSGGPGPQWPGGPLPQGRDGDLYGYSYAGGANNTGSIWQTNTLGTVSVIYSFGSGTGNDCQNGMTLGADGNFYGTALTNCGGPGYLFKVTPTGILTVLHTFTGTPDGSGPGLLVQYTDGDFYGVTSSGGANNLGSAFKVTPTGTLTILHSFDNTNGLANPSYGLTVGNDGNFYGSTTSGNGSIFKMTPTGVTTLLHTFAGGPNDGASPVSGVILGKDGNFYGTTQYGGSVVYDEFFNEGTVFKMTPAGTVTILHNFNLSTDYAVFPTTPLLQATDGNFYGTADSCNQFGCGTQDLYKVTTNGTLTVLEEFTGSGGGEFPYWPLMQDTNGIMYGVTQQGGTANGGVLFSLNISAAPFARLMAASGKEGAKIGILGQGFTAASVVKFGGAQATTIQRSGATFINATVPAGALTGSVTVITGTTTLTSSQMFKVTPTFPSFSPTSGSVGTPVALTGTGLTQTTRVTFGGVQATAVTVNSDTQVTANVPTGAVTGQIVITTKGGSAKSRTNFTVD
ncbi:MAG TPA: choice-of-anchor tandem repeat GloVer-containing protein [Chthoniobacterales bacterium]|jgi:uncharacterized repeat protein (TIGR03803 family)